MTDFALQCAKGNTVLSRDANCRPLPHKVLSSEEKRNENEFYNFILISRAENVLMGFDNIVNPSV
jgi:hypothetical protein